MAAGLGFKTFNTGDVLSAADVNGYLMQGVLVFASTAARDAAITAPAEGQFAFTKDTNSLFYYDGAAWVASGATGDIEGVTAGTGISGGGTSGTVTITNSMATAIDAKGDLIVGTGADTFSKLSAGTNGYLLTADSAEATGLKWAAAAGGGGKVLQVVSGSSTTATTISSTSYTDSSLSLSITPTSATSKILVLVAQEIKATGGADVDSVGGFQIVRGATNIVTVGPSGYEAFAFGLSQIRMILNYSYLDSPATTSATTYKTQFRKFGTATVIAQDNSAPSQITLLEIGA